MRWRELQRQLKASNVDTALFFDEDPNIRYFSGVPVEKGCLVVPAKGKPVLFVPGFEADRLSRSSAVKVVKCGRSMLDDVESYCRIDSAGVVPSNVSYAVVDALAKRKVQLSDIGELCTSLRVVKSKEEIARHAKACAITDVLFEELLKMLPNCRSERDAVSYLKWLMAQAGFEPSFAPIVASGRNAAVPHHVPDDTKLSGFTVIDFGIVYENYCSDMTRTVYIGVPSKRERDVYEKLLAVQESCIGRMRAGESFEAVDAFARKSVGKSMIHRVGHSLGVEVHDVQPRPWTLAPGNVVTVEPGTYPGRFGIRIEDDVVVTKSEPVVLSRAPKDLILVSRNI